MLLTLTGRWYRYSLFLRTRTQLLQELQAAEDTRLYIVLHGFRIQLQLHGKEVIDDETRY